MQRAIPVITGRPGLLAAHIALDRARNTPSPIFCALPIISFESFGALLRSCGPNLFESHGRLLRVSLDDIPPNAEIWHFLDTTEAMDSPFIEQLQVARIAALNIVFTPFCGGDRWRWLLPRRSDGAAVEPASFGFPVTRQFRTSLLISPDPGESPSAQEGALHFLATLHDLKTEIMERGSDYFEQRALRCQLAPDTPINLVRLDKAVAMIIAGAGRPAGFYPIASAASWRADALFEHVGAAYDISLLATGDVGTATLACEVDSLFAHRLGDFAAHLDDPRSDMRDASSVGAGLGRDDAVIGPDELDAWLRSIAEQQRQFYQSARRSLALPPTRFEHRRAPHRGMTIRYDRIGQGPRTLVLLTALGQDASAMLRLMHQLGHRNRVLVWTPRGLDEGDPDMTIAAHAADLATILDAEGIDECHLVAWCTGPKVAAAFIAEHPGRVATAVFLNATAKCCGSPPELDTAYEQNFASLCKLLEQRPSLAPSVMASLSGGPKDEPVDPALEDEQDISATVLAAVSQDLRKPILRPFQSPERVVRYVKQLADFWSYDIGAVAAQIDIPLLLLSSEHDSVASPLSSDWIARRFANAQIVQVKGATHYFLHDRADVVAALIEDFVETHARDTDQPAAAPAHFALAQSQ